MLVLTLHGAHIVRAFVVNATHMLDQVIHGLPGHETVITVFEIDVIRLEIIVAAHLEPEILVNCQVGRREMLHSSNSSAQMSET